MRYQDYLKLVIVGLEMADFIKSKIIARLARYINTMKHLKGDQVLNVFVKP